LRKEFVIFGIRSFRVLWQTIDDLGDMDGFGRQASPVKPAVDVGNTTRIASDHYVCSAGFDVLDFTLEHRGGYLRMLYGEYASEAAAFLRARQLDQLSTLYSPEKKPGLLVHLEIAQQVA
jgi:hypothetical protein